VDVEAIDARKYVQNPQEVTKAPSSPVTETFKTAEAPAPKVIENVAQPKATQEKVNVLSTTGTFVQVGAFRAAENAETLSKKILAQNIVERVPVNSWYNQGVYRVRIGPYASRADAELAAEKLKKALDVNTYIIDQP